MTTAKAKALLNKFEKFAEEWEDINISDLLYNLSYDTMDELVDYAYDTDRYSNLFQWLSFDANENLYFLWPETRDDEGEWEEELRDRYGLEDDEEIPEPDLKGGYWDYLRANDWILNVAY